MFENPRRGRQARNFTTNAPKILDLKSSSEQIFSRKLPLGAPAFCMPIFSCRPRKLSIICSVEKPVVSIRTGMANSEIAQTFPSLKVKFAIEQGKYFRCVSSPASIRLSYGFPQESFIQGGAAPRSNPFTLLYTMFDRKGTLFVYLPLANGTVPLSTYLARTLHTF